MSELSERCNFLVNKERHASDTLMTSRDTHFFYAIRRSRAEAWRVCGAAHLRFGLPFGVRFRASGACPHRQPSQPDKG